MSDDVRTTADNGGTTDPSYVSTDVLTGIRVYDVNAMTQDDYHGIIDNWDNMADDEGLECVIAKWESSVDTSGIGLVADLRREPEGARYRLDAWGRGHRRGYDLRADNWRDAIMEAQGKALKILEAQQHDQGLGL